VWFDGHRKQWRWYIRRMDKIFYIDWLHNTPNVPYLLAVPFDMVTLFQIILYGKECGTRMIHLYKMIIVPMHPLITLFRSITIFCGAYIILKNIPHIHDWMWGIFYIILPIPQNVVMNLNNVMLLKLYGSSFTTFA
jgi:hypothetical protein